MIICNPCAELIAYQLQYLCCYVDIYFPDFVLACLCVVQCSINFIIASVEMFAIYCLFNFCFIAK